MQCPVYVSKIIIVADVVDSFAVDFKGFWDIVEIEVDQIMEGMSQSLQRVMLRAIEKESILPELREMGKGGSFCIGDRRLAFKLWISKSKESKRRYLACIVGGKGVLSKRVEKGGLGSVFRGWERAEMECRV
jgi:hypothetical protein